MESKAGWKVGARCERCGEAFGRGAGKATRRLREPVRCSQCGGQWHRLCQQAFEEGEVVCRCCGAGQAGCAVCGRPGGEKAVLADEFGAVGVVWAHWACGLLAGAAADPKGQLCFYGPPGEPGAGCCEVCGGGVGEGAAGCAQPGCPATAHVYCLLAERELSDSQAVSFDPAQLTFELQPGERTSLFEQLKGRTQKFQLAVVEMLDGLRTGGPAPSYSAFQQLAALRELSDFAARRPVAVPAFEALFRLRERPRAAFLCRRHALPQEPGERGCAACGAALETPSGRTVPDEEVCAKCDALDALLDNCLRKSKKVDGAAVEAAAVQLNRCGLTLFDSFLAAFAHHHLCAKGLTLEPWSETLNKLGGLLLFDFEAKLRFVFQRGFEQVAARLFEARPFLRDELATEDALAALFRQASRTLGPFAGLLLPGHILRQNAHLRALHAVENVGRLAAAQKKPAAPELLDELARQRAALPDDAPLQRLIGETLERFAELAEQLVALLDDRDASVAPNSPDSLRKLLIDSQAIPAISKIGSWANPLARRLLPALLGFCGVEAEGPAGFEALRRLVALPAAAGLADRADRLLAFTKQLIRLSRLSKMVFEPAENLLFQIGAIGSLSKKNLKSLLDQFGDFRDTPAFHKLASVESSPNLTELTLAPAELAGHARHLARPLTIKFLTDEEADFLRDRVLQKNLELFDEARPCSLALLRQKLPGAPGGPERLARLAADLADCDALLAETAEGRKKVLLLGELVDRARPLGHVFVDHPGWARLQGLAEVARFAVAQLGAEVRKLSVRDAAFRLLRAKNAFAVEDELAQRLLGAAWALKAEDVRLRNFAVEMTLAILASRLRRLDADGPDLKGLCQAVALVELFERWLPRENNPMARLSTHGRLRAQITKCLGLLGLPLFAELASALPDVFAARAAGEQLAKIDSDALVEWVELFLESFENLEETLAKLRVSYARVAMVTRSFALLLRLLLLPRMVTRAAAMLPVQLFVTDRLLKLKKFSEKNDLANSGVPALAEAAATVEELIALTHRFNHIFRRPSLCVAGLLSAAPPPDARIARAELEALLVANARLAPCFRNEFDYLWDSLQTVRELRKSLAITRQCMLTDLSTGRFDASDLHATLATYNSCLATLFRLYFADEELAALVVEVEQLLLIADLLVEAFDAAKARHLLVFFDNVQNLLVPPKLVAEVRALIAYMEGLAECLGEEAVIGTERLEAHKQDCVRLVSRAAVPAELRRVFAFLDAAVELEKLDEVRKIKFSREDYTKLLATLFAEPPIRLSKEVDTMVLRPLRREAKIQGLRSQNAAAVSSVSRFVEETYRREIFFPQPELDLFLQRKTEQFFVATDAASRVVDMESPRPFRSSYEWDCDCNSETILPRTPIFFSDAFAAPGRQELAQLEDLDLLDAQEVALVKLAMLVAAAIHLARREGHFVPLDLPALAEQVPLITRQLVMLDVPERLRGDLKAISDYILFQLHQALTETQKFLAAMKGPMLPGDLSFSFKNCIDTSQAINSFETILALKIPSAELPDIDPKETAENCLSLFIVEIDRVYDETRQKLAKSFKEIKVDPKVYFETNFSKPQSFYDELLKSQIKMVEVTDQIIEVPAQKSGDELDKISNAESSDEDAKYENKMRLNNLSTLEKFHKIFKDKLALNPHLQNFSRDPINLFCSKLEHAYESFKGIYSNLKIAHLENYLEKAPSVSKTIQRYNGGKITFDDIVKLAKQFYKNPDKELKPKEAGDKPKAEPKPAHAAKQKETSFMDAYLKSSKEERKKKRIKEKTFAAEKLAEAQKAPSAPQPKQPKPPQNQTGSLLRLTLPKNNRIVFSEMGNQIFFEDCEFLTTEDVTLVAALAAVEKPPVLVLGKFQKSMDEIEKEIIGYYTSKAQGQQSNSKTVYCGFVQLNLTRFSNEFLKTFANGHVLGCAVSPALNFYIGHFYSFKVEIDKLGLFFHEKMPVDFNNLFVFFLKPKPNPFEQQMSFEVLVDAAQIEDQNQRKLAQQADFHRQRAQDRLRDNWPFLSVFGLQSAQQPALSAPLYSTASLDEVSFVFESANPETSSIGALKDELRQLIASEDPQSLAAIYEGLDAATKKFVIDILKTDDPKKFIEFQSLISKN